MSAPGLDRVDRLGTFAGSLCALHCAASGLLPASLSILGLGALMSEEVEWGLTLFAVGFAAFALVASQRQALSVGWPSLLFPLGIAGLLAARWLESAHLPHGPDDHHGGDWGAVLGVLAGLVLVCAHLANLRASSCGREGRGGANAGSS